MELLSGSEVATPPGIEDVTGKRLRAFRSMDAWAVDACQTATALARHDGSVLAAEILRAVARAGGAFVAACSSRAGGPEERLGLEAARARLLEARYHLYLARRLGHFDARRYRALALRQESALREISSLLDEAR